MRTTPTTLGYLVAAEVSVAFAGAALALSQGATDPLAWPFALVYVQVLACVLAPPGVLLVHHACRGVRRQWVHVLAAGLVALAAGLAVALTVAPGVDGLRHPVWVAVSASAGAALGRWLVRPQESQVLGWAP